MSCSGQRTKGTKERIDVFLSFVFTLNLYFRSSDESGIPSPANGLGFFFLSFAFVLILLCVLLCRGNDVSFVAQVSVFARPRATIYPNARSMESEFADAFVFMGFWFRCSVSCLLNFTSSRELLGRSAETANGGHCCFTRIITLFMADLTVISGVILRRFFWTQIEFKLKIFRYFSFLPLSLCWLIVI